jgi:hypothetical protein
MTNSACAAIRPFGSLFGGRTPPGAGFQQLSRIAREGITCDVCHLMALPSAPGFAVRRFRLDGARQGNIPDPVENPFHPSAHEPMLSSSEACAPCHDVRNPLGVLVERTYTEWRESLYPGRGITCQVCHMTWVEEPVAVGAPPRRRHRHVMAGVDVPLSDFPGREQLLEEVEYLLQNAVRMSVTAPARLRRDSVLTVQVTIANNITGHDIPTGSIFMRQMWVELIVRGRSSGTVPSTLRETLDANGDLRTLHSEEVQKRSCSAGYGAAALYGHGASRTEDPPPSGKLMRWSSAQFLPSIAGLRATGFPRRRGDGGRSWSCRFGCASVPFRRTCCVRWGWDIW